MRFRKKRWALFHKILIIEDEPAIGRILQDKLTREGHLLTRRFTAREGFAALAEDSADLVLLDLTLDDMDGFEALRRIRSCAPSPRVVMLIEQARENESPMALSLGACGVILKPFKPTNVAALIRKILS